MHVTRRTAITALTAASYSRIKGANDRIGVGFIGYGLIGAQHVFDFKAQPDCDLLALSDVYQPRLEQGVAACGSLCKGYADFHHLLDNKDVSAVVVSTPDHWHALLTMMSCAAGKDVYVEKPLTLFVREGRWMTDVARRNKRVVQCGTQQRSGLHYAKARQLLQDGYLGKITGAAIAFHRNILPGFGAPADALVPPGFDYNVWLGPAPERAFNPKRGIYHFRWFWDYSGGQMTNLGAHDLDIVHWITGVKGPVAASSSGGRFALDSTRDNGETPDTQDAILEYPGFTVTVSIRETSAGRKEPYDLQIFGAKGSLSITRSGFVITGDPKVDPRQTIPVFKGHPAGGPKPAGVSESAEKALAPETWCADLRESGSSPEQFTRHVRNFLDCIKTRELPVSDVEDGHGVAVACHLANISLRVGRKVHWNPETEQIGNDREASEMLQRPYRHPWDDTLRSLIS